MAKKVFNMTKENRYLHFPVLEENPEKFFFVTIYEEKIRKQEIYLGITSGKADFYCPYYVSPDCGDEVTLTCFDGDVPEDIFEGVKIGKEPQKEPGLYPNLYHEEGRQQVHFSPLRGWMNDPNGLVCIDGKYHMSFQHNNFGPNHGTVNVSWGLAVSDDGVHFTQYTDVIYPWDSMTHIASGSATIDSENILGKGKNTVIAVFTGLNSYLQYKGRESMGTRGQYLYCSTDGGFTFKNAWDKPIIPVAPGQDWRDPKILKLDGGMFCIAVYETENGRDGVAFYSSKNLKDWKRESFTDDLYECPDIFKVKCQETGEDFWVLYGNNNKYRIGKFENFRFESIDDFGYMDYGNDAHAGQTFNCTGKESERLHFAWICDYDFPWYFDENTHNTSGFSQSMSLLCKCTVHKTPKGYRMFRTPIDAFEKLREPGCGSLSFKKSESEEAVYDILKDPCELILTVPKEKDFAFGFGDIETFYDAGKETVNSTQRGHSASYELAMPYENVTFRVILDKNSIEIFVNGEISCTYTLHGEKKIDIPVKYSDNICESEIYKLKSIW